MRRLLGREVLLRRVAGPLAHEDAIGAAAGRAPPCRRCFRESTTTSSSAHDTESRAARMFAASFARDDGDRQLRHTGSIARLPAMASRLPGQLPVAAESRGLSRRHRVALPAPTTAARPMPPPTTGASWTVSKSTTDAAVVEDRLQLGVARRREVALRLDDEEVRRQPGLELLLLGVEPPLGQIAGGPRRVDALAVGVQRAGDLAHLGGHGQLEAAQLQLDPALYDTLRARQRRLGAAAARAGSRR